MQKPAAMKVSLGADHGAFLLREALIPFLNEFFPDGVIDHGTYAPDSVDYPDYANKVAEDVLSHRADLGILCCTTGIGMSIAANKIPGIRAGLACHPDEAALTRQHNHANVLCMGALHTTAHEARELVRAFVGAFPEGGRHQRRVGKFTEWESTCTRRT